MSKSAWDESPVFFLFCFSFGFVDHKKQIFIVQYVRLSQNKFIADRLE